MQGISGIGFTLACDFLKEIGFDTAKPDLHILAFLNEMYTQQLEAKKIILGVYCLKIYH